MENFRGLGTPKKKNFEKISSSDFFQNLPSVRTPAFLAIQTSGFERRCTGRSNLDLRLVSEPLFFRKFSWFSEFLKGKISLYAAFFILIINYKHQILFCQEGGAWTTVSFQKNSGRNNYGRNTVNTTFSNSKKIQKNSVKKFFDIAKK